MDAANKLIVQVEEEMTTDLSSWVGPLLQGVERCSVAVLGDFCLDAYWSLHEDATEISVETGLPVRHVKSQRYSLGGAGNVLANLAAIGVGRVRAIGVSGKDPFGVKLRELIGEQGCSTEGIVVDPEWQTMVYAKPCIGESEQSRIDFGAFNVPRQDSIDEILRQMVIAAEQDDVVILNQQVDGGLSSPAVINRMNAVMAKRRSTKFLVDARHHPEKYEGAMLKLNMHEAARLLNKTTVKADEESDALASEFALSINALTGEAAFITRGDRGMAVAQDGSFTLIPAFTVEGATDPVGAGDTVVASVAAALAAGATPVKAGVLANLAAMITVKKLQTTGTASVPEILAAVAALDGRSAKPCFAENV